MSQFVGPSGEVRLKNDELVVPVVIGTCAFYLGKRATDTQTHRWNLYLRGGQGQALHHIVKKVVFNLHNTFVNPNREVLAPPFELEEYGWGEFELSATIHFHDDALERPREVYHKLKLYAEDGSLVQNTKKPVVAEAYDELVFSQPVAAFRQRLAERPAPPAPPVPHLAPFFTAFSEEADLARAERGRSRIAQQRQNLHRQMEALM